MKLDKKLLGVAGAVVAVYLLWPAKAPEPANEGLLFDRVWVDKKPEKPTDYVQGFFAADDHKAGVFLNASQFDFHFERFDFKKKKGKLEVVFPQTGKKAEIAYSVKTCNEVKDFDLCLDVAENPWGGPKRYYASTEQEQRALPGVAPAARALLAP